MSSFAGADSTKKTLSDHFKAVRDGSASLDNPFTRFKDKIRIEQSGTPIEKKLEAINEVVALQQKEIDSLKAQKRRSDMAEVFENNATSRVEEINNEHDSILRDIIERELFPKGVRQLDRPPSTTTLNWRSSKAKK